MRAGLTAFLGAVSEYPAASQTLLVEIIGAGPQAMERRDAILEGFAQLVDDENRRAHEHFGVPRLAALDDAFALVGAVVELASRQLRLRRPGDVRDLEPVIDRLLLAVLRPA